MLSITKEILEYIEIKAVYISIVPDKKVVCLPVQFYDDCWRIYIGLDNNFTSKSAYLEILKTDDEFIKVPCKIKKLDQNYKQYIIFFIKPLPLSISYKINVLKDKYGSAEKRQGLRLKVGRENYRLFGLDNIKQRVVISGFEYDCIIEDVSMHGIRISFYYPRFQTGAVESLTLISSVLGIKLMFINPVLCLFLITEPIRVDSADKETGKLTIGCKIKEPVNIGFINRVSEFEKKMERGYVFQQERQ
ncbi:hypothetical protein [Treponema denticola]|uniref:hypothetical protein n=1 Tax=Treponema denticola TaxID=158 RepID=UPI0021062B74|nr:hypothetical protein [Treponema denticola]UTY23454.1 hypothetical protein E4N78_04360 [Treponema denticola]